MKISKTRLSAIAAGIALASSATHAEIELGKGMSVTGFVDMSFFHTDVDGAPSTDNVFGVDQVETTFKYKGSDGVTAQVDIEYGESEPGFNAALGSVAPALALDAGGNVVLATDAAAVTPLDLTVGSSAPEDGTFVEQAIIAKQITDQLSVKAGRFLSYSGWETEEPTGLFQYSGTGYAPIFYGYYQQGVSVYYDAGMVDLAVSVVNDAFANPVETDTTQLGTELMFAITPIESVTAKLFYITEGDKEAINFWASYSVDAFTFAGEYNTAEDTVFVGSEADGFLVMGNYAVGDFGFTVRYHAYEIEGPVGPAITEMSGITFAPSYAVGDNLLLVAEYRMDEDDVSNIDTNTFALEALFTF